MFTFINLTRIGAGLGAVGGIITYYQLDNGNKGQVFASYNQSISVSPTQKWDCNWDGRQPETDKKSSNSDEVNNNVKKKPTAVRHIILIRHGQYNLSGQSPEEKTLTELGRKQAIMAGERLKELDLPYTTLISSTMIRAKETASFIHKALPKVPSYECPLLEEGAPIPPEPPVGHWRPPHSFYQDGARIEAAFRKYFYRADVEQECDSYDIIVCHANVIRYFVCRALQYPPEGWLRLSLRHASITWLSIMPGGRVLLRCYGDAGYMPPYALTTS